MTRFAPFVFTLLVFSCDALTQREMALLKPPKKPNAVRALLTPLSFAQLVSPEPPPPPPPSGFFP
jgi:hypothetical protein